MQSFYTEAKRKQCTFLRTSVQQNKVTASFYCRYRKTVVVSNNQDVSAVFC